VGARQGTMTRLPLAVPPRCTGLRAHVNPRLQHRTARTARPAMHKDRPVTVESKTAEAKAGESGGIGELIKVVVQALLIAVVVRTLLFQPFNIPSGSMIPTLLVGDYIYVSKYAYGYSNHSPPYSPDIFSGRILASTPKRGDVIVFKLPRDGQTDYIKRLIGMPGDKVQMKEGRLYVNDVLVPREPIPKVIAENFSGRETEVPTYKETLPGGVSHTIIEIQGDNGMNDNTEPFIVPPNNYFMMGDNRDNSLDSRVPPDQQGVGYVPFEDLVGRAEVIFFSVADGEPAWMVWKWPWTVRWSRLLQRIH
jgi:signal peptidase I